MSDKNENPSYMLSTTSVSKILDMDRDELFAYMQSLRWIKRESGSSSWKLTSAGKEVGGTYQTKAESEIQWIVWPAEIAAHPVFKEFKEQRDRRSCTASDMAKQFKVSPQQINLILSELGWIEKHPVSGWNIRPLGVRNGGEEHYLKETGIPFVVWPSNILQNQIFIQNVEAVKDTSLENSDESLNQGEDSSHSRKNESSEDQTDDFRKQYPAKYRTMDGHYVRSKAEMIIDNWLYINEIVHAYERKVPVEEDLCSDFFIMKNKVYIEYWGYENKTEYLANKRRKQEIYKKYGINLIELQDSDIPILDDVLPKKLMKFHILAY